jgi:7-cyano-7-deazaguanine synthase in queuosine biosynthesis
MFSDLDQEGYVANKFELPGGLDSIAIATYWQKHRDRIRGLNLHTSERRVITPAYSASYSDDLDSVFTVLDELVDASREAETDLRH